MFDVGDTRTFEQRTFNPAGVLAAPAALTLAITTPAEITTTYSIAGGTITQDAVGEYHRDVLLNLAGVWRWTWTVTGASGDTEVESGAINVGGPRDATPWIGAEDVFTCRPCSTIADADKNYAEAALAALAATEILYLLTRRLYPGIATLTVRPCRQSHIWDQPGWVTPHHAARWGSCTCGAHTPGGCTCGTSLHAIDLGGQILDIHEVLIDGAAFTNYRLDRNRWLVRTDGDGWPSAQDLNLATTQPNTWSVTYSAGRTPPTAGILAARRLACEIYQGCSGSGECTLPKNIQSLTGQGEAIVFADPADLMTDGKTGLWVVDQFLNAETYGNAHLGTVTVSPDAGPRAWRTG